MKKLIAADYITTRKDASSARQQTVYSLTAGGRAALRQYMANLQLMLGFSTTAKSRSGSAPVWPATVLSEK